MSRELIHLTTIIHKEEIGTVKALDLEKMLEDYFAGTKRQRVRWGVEHLAQSSIVVNDTIYVTTTLTVNISGSAIGGYANPKTL